MLRLTSLLGNSQKLDGGAMFGHVPKTVWNKWMMADERNRILLSCRALLIQEENRNVLLETGIGAFFNPALRDRYGVYEQDHVLLQSLHRVGLTENDIDCIILSHLHFDHAGGLLSAWQENNKPTLLFPRAQYVVSKLAWERACYPHMRDQASFVPELNELLEQSNRLQIIEGEQCDFLGDRYQFKYSDGHTPGLMHTIFYSTNATIIFVSDLIPGRHWIHLPVCMGYDRAPEQLVDEKRKILEFARQKNAYLFFTHDPEIAMCKIKRDENGKYISADVKCELTQFECSEY